MKKISRKQKGKSRKRKIQEREDLSPQKKMKNREK